VLNVGDKFWQATKDFVLDLLGLKITSRHQCPWQLLVLLLIFNFYHHPQKHTESLCRAQIEKLVIKVQYWLYNNIHCLFRIEEKMITSRAYCKGQWRPLPLLLPSWVAVGVELWVAKSRGSLKQLLPNLAGLSHPGASLSQSWAAAVWLTPWVALRAEPSQAIATLNLMPKEE